MSTVVLFAILGLGSGAAYAILACGVVLVHRGSGTLSFAQGAVCMFAAFFFARLVEQGVPKPVALVVTLLAAGAFGAVWHAAVMRPLRSAPILAKVIVTLGLLTALEGAASLWFGDQIRNAPKVLPTGDVGVFGIQFGQDRLWLLGITIVIAIALAAWYSATLIGVSTRAAAENPRGAALLGFSPDLIAATNWAIGCALAGLAGILIAPIVGLSIGGLTLLILPALAAALLGGFRSFGLTALAGILIGSAQSEIGRYWKQTGVTDALPFAVVIAAVVLTGRLIPERGTISTVRLPLAPRDGIRPRSAVALVVVAVAGLALLNGTYQSGLTTSLVTISVALSVVIVTGFVGQTSLMPMTFAGIGGLLTSKFAEDLNVPFPFPLVLAAVCMVPIGMVLGLPALRVRGLNLAVVTIGAAVAVNAVLFLNRSWTGGQTGSLAPSPSIFGFSLDPSLHRFRFGLFCVLLTALLVWGTGNLRRGPSGLRMLAVRSNERAATASGISVSSAKLQAFAVSAAVAGVSGSLLSYQIGAVSFDRFDVFGSIGLIVLVYIGGVSVVSGAIFAGLAAEGGVFYLLVQDAIGSVARYYGLASGLLLLLTIVANPDGAVIAARRQWAWWSARGSRPHAVPASVPTPAHRPAETQPVRRPEETTAPSSTPL
ncbi:MULTISPECIES: ABC transporter permease [Frankia]|uniref:High-affinity branched-chain amino acid transport system permease protein putative membrane protein n=1 Tax=Frankia alni (strain DSM 45986 / CECT 9034 / ACN14a) TaxID=326424 RepID=Q0RFR6_FRAAA|nr:MULTISPECIES: ABC transporter permease [Frankia]CAJ63675.1 putative High-affinity branched-chain amino acid transport system permease protein; putative membrane protein [Frankia alni ACN14a]